MNNRVSYHSYQIYHIYHFISYPYVMLSFGAAYTLSYVTIKWNLPFQLRNIDHVQLLTILFTLILFGFLGVRGGGKGMNQFAANKYLCITFRFVCFFSFSLALEKLVSPGGWIDITMTMGVSGLFEILRNS